MSFNVNDKVTVVNSGKTYSTYRDWMEEHGKQWKSQWAYNVDPKNGIVVTIVAKGKYDGFCSDMLYLIQCDDKVYIIGEQGIKAVETVGFKVGDEVKVICASGSSKATLGDVVTVTNIIEDDGPPGWPIVDVKTKDGKVYGMYAKRFELATKSHDSKDIIKRTLDGEQWTLPEWGSDYLVFNNGELGYSGGGNPEWSHWEHRKDWVKYTAPPRFTINTLVYNTDGTIGRVVEDKGIYKGIRRYSVSFNAIRDTVKSVDEAELTKYKQ